STLGAETAAGLQTAVPLTQIKGRLDSYLNARLGRPVGIKPLSDLPGAQTESSAWVVSDSRFIYLPDEVDRFSTRIENRTLAKVLVRLEAGFFESGSFDFDLERAADHYPEVAERTVGIGAASDPEGLGDAERFFTTFDRPRLARTLFDLFEQARVLRRMTDAYPGLAAHLGPALRQQARDLITGGAWTAPLALLYARLLPGFMPDHAMFREPPGWAATLAQRFDLALTARSGVEVCALLVCLAYETPAGQTAAPFPLPFHRRLRWDLVRRAQARTFRLVERIKTQLARQRIKVYRSDLRQRLAEQHGRITTDDIQSLVVSNGPATDAGRMAIDESALDLAALLRATGVDPAQAGPAEAKAVYYPEWDHQLQEYLPNHTRVRERLVAGDSDSGFYRQTLDDYRGMVARIRRAFEFLKPQGLAILRQWPEGDAFDYRALLDFAIDLKAGRTPSDRLFVKRLKQTRDVAALLLVDLSRSTANTVVGGRSTVLQTAKAALVLFCEALQVVGDTFAIAGFSGTGRLDVDYFRIKDFDSPLDNAVHGRISALQPQRSTRMGAAIRHATAQLAQMPARVRLLIVVSDGFPNDTGYKADHAIADTRHAAQEARARGVHLKAITVNIGSDPGLDDLYGRVHHHVISDVRELPDKLVRLYGTLTRRI
ncbi:MAG: VWA domain-containing protein, partial [Desulfatitalea sp.]|nr:VWA domain-containing protein [Desulfatitalea sp.]NNK00824.1 VWA domain-containing protein [Desulfatitalea sp.]